MKSMKSLFFVLICSVFCFSVAAQVPASMPDFKFYTSNQAGFTKNNIPAGKQSLIVFFDATCPHCQKVAGELSKKTKELSKINIYMVSLDEFRTINYFMEHYAKSLIGLKNVTLLQDRDHVFIPLFSPSKYPSVYLYSADKKLKFNNSGEVEVSKILNKL
jgi:peroxiredoxin